MTTAREKNIEHDLLATIEHNVRLVMRHKVAQYDFAALNQAMNLWFNKEIYSPYAA